MPHAILAATREKNRTIVKSADTPSEKTPAIKIVFSMALFLKSFTVSPLISSDLEKDKHDLHRYLKRHAK